MPAKKRYYIIVIENVALVLIVILALWLLSTSCCSFNRPPNDTGEAPDYHYSYNLINNGTIDHVTIKSYSDFYYINDLRFKEIAGNDLEVKLWGSYMMPTVAFEKNGTNLTLDIMLRCAIDNDFGTPYANEYVYLPANWSYTIIAENEKGETTVDNNSWNYTKIASHLPGSPG